MRTTITLYKDDIRKAIEEYVRNRRNNNSGIQYTEDTDNNLISFSLAD